ncbi:DJ-1/PfpI/YhbO family deglycase/protease [Erythrobacter arachoides]|uniref:DJ-1/PfpI/YhbO family deglycase/protease n=1 Tax=Aurantiacibacter arachoides TaxID=1850444 RepID=A0A845A7N6_9SPHN|nr:type 1 glutamine amidotransferase domain-containing protein [Aurantiacibacter arachoides]MXO93559.1 DJ-1/PfpI/YhbO family deglycase/protease [Aurantiacibacter arachoides]GGD48442.1 glutamine amidotransferase [Aurantiacibacter arachoides]
MSKRIMILATNGFEQSELEQPKATLEKQGYECIVVSPEEGEIKGWDQDNWGDSVKVDMALADANESDFDALVLPGGQMNPDILRMEDKAIELVRAFDDAGKPIAAICHGPWLLVEADIVDGRKVTSWPSVRTDLENAGADVVDDKAVVDGNLVTSRNPDDIPAFCEALIDLLETETAEIA